jgi:hypothetical protein
MPSTAADDSLPAATQYGGIYHIFDGQCIFCAAVTRTANRAGATEGVGKRLALGRACGDTAAPFRRGAFAGGLRAKLF